MTPSTGWRKSSFSQGGNTDCVEVAFALAGAAVRDSKHATGPTLQFPTPTRLTFSRVLRRDSK